MASCFQVPQDTPRNLNISDTLLLENGQQMFELVLVGAVQGIQELPYSRLLSCLPKLSVFVDDLIECLLHLLVDYLIQQQREPLVLHLFPRLG